MGTSFDDVIDLALVTINDTRINKLAKKDYSAFLTFMDGLLVRATPLFTDCLQSLSYDIVTREFVSTFNNLEKDILARLINLIWMEEITQNDYEINNLLNNREAKVFSPSENLKQKSEYSDRLREKANQIQVDYQLKNLKSIPWFQV